jgi:hypothetical protein
VLFFSAKEVKIFKDLTVKFSRSEDKEIVAGVTGLSASLLIVYASGYVKVNFCLCFTKFKLDLCNFESNLFLEFNGSSTLEYEYFLCQNVYDQLTWSFLRTPNHIILDFENRKKLQVN